jgi:hypothetical protein
MKTYKAFAIRTLVATVATVMVATIAAVSPASATGGVPADPILLDPDVPLEVEVLPNGDLYYTQPDTGFALEMTQREFLDAFDEVVEAMAEELSVRTGTPVAKSELITCFGVTLTGFYFCLSTLAQQMIIGGVTAGLIALLCLIGTPAVCVVAAVIIGAVTVYLLEKGICPDGKSLKVTVSWLGTKTYSCE